jgi:CRP-like cAMP-binding protein
MNAVIFSVLFHVGNAVALLALLLKDQLQLRTVFLVSLALQAIYYFEVPGGPLVDPLAWKVVLIAANLVMIILLFRDRLPFGVASDLQPLFRKIAVLTHGQFRRLIKPAERVRGVAGAPPILTQGERSSALFYLISGTASVQKHGQTIVVEAESFLGEISFLTQHAATATVTLDDGAECLAWPRAALAALLAKESALDIAIRGLLNHDLAGKVSASPLTHAAGPARQRTAAAG